MQPYLKLKDTEELGWQPILFTILDKAPNLQTMLPQLEKEIYPTSWSGSYADVLVKRLTLFAKLFQHPNLEIRDWAIKQHQKLQLAIQAQRERESKENQERVERFE